MEAKDHKIEDMESASSDSITDSDEDSVESENDHELHTHVSSFFHSFYCLVIVSIVSS